MPKMSRKVVQKMDADFFLRVFSYNPNVGQFTSLDSFAGGDENPLSLNKYLYTNGDPINGIDPTGRDAIFPTEMLAYALLGAPSVPVGGALDPRALGQPGVPTGPIYLKDKIIDELMRRSFLGVFTLSLINRFSDYISANEPIVFYDAENEMTPLLKPQMKLSVEKIMKQYAQYNSVGPQWQQYTISLQKAPAQAGGWSVGSDVNFLHLQFWLNGAHSVDVKMMVEMRRTSSGLEYRNMDADWYWNDEIQAHSFIEAWPDIKGAFQQGLIRGVGMSFITGIEGMWDLVGDKILDAGYPVRIHWKFKDPTTFKNLQ